jgi:hypothetical protein
VALLAPYLVAVAAAGLGVLFWRLRVQRQAG